MLDHACRGIARFRRGGGAVQAHLMWPKSVGLRGVDPVERPVHRVELWPNLIIRASCGGTAPVATGR